MWTQTTSYQGATVPKSKTTWSCLRLFTRTRETNENTTKVSYRVAFYLRWLKTCPEELLALGHFYMIKSGPLWKNLDTLVQKEDCCSCKYKTQSVSPDLQLWWWANLVKSIGKVLQVDRTFWILKFWKWTGKPSFWILRANFLAAIRDSSKLLRGERRGIEHWA